MHININSFFEEMEKMAAKANEQCPFATYNIARNTKNRNAARANHMYGPLNPKEPGDYWKRLAKKWKASEKVAKKYELSSKDFSIDENVRTLYAGGVFPT